MAKYNTSGNPAQRPVVQATSPMRTSGGIIAQPTARTFEGGPAWEKDAKTDLFIRATSSFHGREGSFYESGDERDDKLRTLVRQVTLEDPDWVFEFARWLRGPGNIRTAALVIAAEFVKTRLDAGLHGTAGTRVGEPGTQWATVSSRAIIDAVCQRADEPGELLAYWQYRYGNQAARAVKGIQPSPKLPMPLKRGLADAAARMYWEGSLLKYDTGSHVVRFADILELCHVRPHVDKASWQGDLFRHAIDRRHKRENTDIPASLAKIQHNGWIRAQAQLDPSILLDPEHLKNAGMTWEDALSLAGSKVDKAKLWEAMIPNMGYMALLRNLRNFDEAGISNTAVRQVLATLEDPNQVMKSRQLPFRFYSAFKNAPNLRWGPALQSALDVCLPNIPEMPGRSLILIDTSGSMGYQVSDKSSITCIESAALFGAALALKNQRDATLVQYASTSEPIAIPRGGSVLTFVQKIMGLSNRCGWGTNIAGAIRDNYTSDYDRVIVLSDGQGTSEYGNKAAGVGSSVPKDKPVYVFNIQGYTQSPMPTGGAARFDLGGLTDATFALIPRLEAGVSGVWPWEIEKAA